MGGGVDDFCEVDRKREREREKKWTMDSQGALASKNGPLVDSTSHPRHDIPFNVLCDTRSDTLKILCVRLCPMNLKYDLRQARFGGRRSADFFPRSTFLKNFRCEDFLRVAIGTILIPEMSGNRILNAPKLFSSRYFRQSVNNSILKAERMEDST